MSQSDLGSPLLADRDSDSDSLKTLLSTYVSKQQARTTNEHKLLGIRVNYWILISICFLTFGSYWVFDTPGALEDQLKEWFGHGYNDASNAALYSVYSFPNIILPMFGGYFVDRLTVRKSGLLFTCLVTLGDFIFCLGIEFKLYWLAVMGRFIFGLGGESLTVAQNTYTIRWFDGKQLALVFGLVVAFSRIGTAVNFIVSPKFANPPYGVPFSCWFGCLMCAISLLNGIGVGVLDRWASDKIDQDRSKHFRSLPKRDRLALLKEDQRHEPTNDEVHISDIRNFPIEAWLLFSITMFFYIAILTFNTVAQTILTKTGNHYSDDAAGNIMAIPSFVAIAASPFFGWLVDRVGRGLYWIALASAGMIFAHVYYLMMAYDVAFTLTLGPIPIMIWIGVFYSMGASSLWPILSFILDKKITGTGYGVMTAIQNFGLAIFPLIISGIQSANGIDGTKLQYTVPIIVFIGCTVVSFLLTLILIRFDYKSGSRLNASAADRQAKLDEAQKDHVESAGNNRTSETSWNSQPESDGLAKRKSSSKLLGDSAESVSINDA